MPTLTIDPILQCTYMEQLVPNTNYGSSTQIILGEQYTDKVSNNLNALLRTDISAIPAGATIAATSRLRLYVISHTGGAGKTLSVFGGRTLRAWTENGATWNKYDGTNAWTSGGGEGYTTDFNDPLAVFTLPDVTATWFEWTGAGLAAFLQDALDTRAGIVQMVLFSYNALVDGYWVIASDDYATTTLRPQLIVDYTTPGATARRRFAASV